MGDRQGLVKSLIRVGGVCGVEVEASLHFVSDTASPGHETTGRSGAKMSLTSVMTGLVLFFASGVGSEPNVPNPITCLTRGADLTDQGLLVLCPPDCLGSRGSVFGTGVYASVSSVCGAALHRGLLGEAGGLVQVHRLQGRNDYISSFSHGVLSQALTHWSASFSLSKPVPPPQELARETSTTQLPASAKKQKKLPAKKVPAPGNKDCPMDIAIVIDSSSNIGQRRFNLQKNLVGKLVAMLKVGPSGPHVGLVQASDAPKTEFFLSNYTQPKELLFAIKEVTHLGGNTNTGKAIMQTTESFFGPERGGRRGHPRVLLVMIDGWPSDDVEQAATLARESGVNVFVVSVARPAPEELPMVQDKDFLKKAVCKDNGFFSYQIPSWFSTTKHVKPLTQRVCSADAMLCSKTCYNSVNIGFLIDGSSSIGDGNFRLVLDFLAEIARSFDVSDFGARIGEQARRRTRAAALQLRVCCRSRAVHLRPAAGVQPLRPPGEGGGRQRAAEHLLHERRHRHRGGHHLHRPQPLQARRSWPQLPDRGDGRPVVRRRQSPGAGRPPARHHRLLGGRGLGAAGRPALHGVGAEGRPHLLHPRVQRPERLHPAAGPRHLPGLQRQQLSWRARLRRATDTAVT